MLGTVIVALFACAMLININKPKRIVQIQLWYIVVVAFCIYQLGAPSAAYYLEDLGNAILLIHMFNNSSNVSACLKCQCKRTVWAVMLFLVVGLCTFLINIDGFNSVLLYVWSMRNYLRFFIYGAACIYYLSEKDLHPIFKGLFWTLIISTVLSAYQYVILGYRGDYVGGIFGTTTSSNASLNILFIILCVYYLGGYLRKQISFFSMLTVFACSLLSAAFGEIKFFYFEFILICFFVLLLYKPNIKTVLASCIAVIILFVGIGVFQKYNRSFDFFNWDSIIYYASESSYSYTEKSVNRLNGIQQINDLFFASKHSLIGVGMGQADHSSFFSSEIYKNYGHINYSWFVGVFVYLEMGWIGLLSYIGVFVAILNDSLKTKSNNTVIKKSSIILCALALVLMFYNSTLRMDIMYLYMFFLVVPLLKAKAEIKDYNILSSPPKIRFKIGNTYIN